jgi:hypothetical protein
MDNYKVPLAIAGSALAVAAVGLALSLAITQPGPAGISGITGPDGSATGPQGPAGSVGPDGGVGEQGLPGAALVGFQGSKGRPGPAGPAIQGSTGEPGDPGLKGPDGPQGSKGTSKGGQIVASYAGGTGINYYLYTNESAKLSAPYNIFVAQNITIPSTWKVYRVTCTYGAREVDAGQFQVVNGSVTETPYFYYRIITPVSGSTTRTIELFYPLHNSPVIGTEYPTSDDYAGSFSIARNTSALAYNTLVDIPNKTNTSNYTLAPRNDLWETPLYANGAVFRILATVKVYYTVSFNILT